MKQWSEIRSQKLTPEQEERAREWADSESLVINLRKLRELLGITQEQMSRRIERTQSELSRMERREDWRVSTIRRYVQALGGEIELRAVFDDRTVRLDL